MEIQVDHRYDALPVEEWITSGKIAMRMSSAQDAEPGPMLQKCAHVPTKTGMSNTICIYCGSTNHISSRCHNKPNDNREEPRSMPMDLRECAPNNSHNRMSQPQVSHHQTRFDEGLNRQYSPNYVNYHHSPLGSIPGQDLSTMLMELANIQSRSLEMMAASQKSQQETFQELTRADKSQQGQGE